MYGIYKVEFDCGSVITVLVQTEPRIDAMSLKSELWPHWFAVDYYIQELLRHIIQFYKEPMTIVWISAVISLLLLILPPRRLSFMSITLVIGGLSLFICGADLLTIAVLLISSGNILILAESILMRRHLRRLRLEFSSLTQVVRSLEAIEERRQAFIARRQLLGSKAASKVDAMPTE